MLRTINALGHDGVSIGHYSSRLTSNGNKYTKIAKVALGVFAILVLAIAAVGCFVFTPLTLHSFFIGGLFLFFCGLQVIDVASTILEFKLAKAQDQS